MNIYPPVIPVTQSKICTKCNTTKSLTDFSKSKRDGYQSTCKSCIKEYNQIFKVELKEKRQNKKEIKQEYDKTHHKVNSGMYAANTAKRKATKFLATPKWAEFVLINELYDDCSLISESTGIKHEIDHIVPIQSEIVCGLHCFANLQIILKTENISKGNRYWPDMW